MGAIGRALDAFPFVVPVPEHLREGVAAWFGRNAELRRMALVSGDARFSDARLADMFADEIGALWADCD